MDTCLLKNKEIVEGSGNMVTKDRENGYMGSKKIEDSGYKGAQKIKVDTWLLKGNR